MIKIPMAENLLEIAQILSRRFNHWWGGAKPEVPPFRRRDFTYLKRELESGKVITLVGPRQVGKTTLVKQIISEMLNAGIPSKRILYVQLDDIQLRDLSQSLLLDVLKAYELHILGESLDLVREPVYLFLDEVQRAKNWAETVKTYYDSNKQLRFVCTGSASLTITQKSSETLPGRQFAFTMFPLKFADAAVAANMDSLKSEDVKKWSYALRGALFRAWEKNEPSILTEEANKIMMETQQTPLMSYLNRYLIGGGYPEIVIASKNDSQKIQNLFKGYAADIILKDLMPWFKIRDFESAEHLLFLLAAGSGYEINYQEIANRLRGSNYITIKRYINFFEQLNIITLLERYSKSVLGSKKNAKVYFNDVGFRNAIKGLERPEPQEMGILAEIALHDHLERLSYKFNNSVRRQLFYHKTERAEIDFVIRSTKMNRDFPVECKYGQSLTKEQEVLLSQFADENETFAISTTPNSLAQKGNRIEVPLWLMLLLC